MKTFSLTLTAALFATTLFGTTAAQSREQVHVVGSSTVFPFVSVVAEKFGSNQPDFKSPIVESTGTGGGFKLFCEGTGARTPDMSNASRAIKKGEVELCAKNGVTSITEIMIGYDGIVLANDKSEPQMSLSIKQIFLALAKQVPANGKLVENSYKTWKDVDASLPDEAIAVYGPPTTSGTRDAFVEIVMEKGCKMFPEFDAAYPDKKVRKKICHNLREDGGFIDAGENDNLIVQKLKSNPKAFGIFGYSFLEENSAALQGSLIDGVSPTFENISSSSYPVARSLFVYAKDAHVGKIPGLAEFLIELASEDALSEDGYLAEKGLIPMPEEQLTAVVERVETLVE